MTPKELQDKLQELGLNELGLHVICITVHPVTHEIVWASTLPRSVVAEPLRQVLQQVQN